jgi:mevalonate kinase
LAIEVAAEVPSRAGLGASAAVAAAVARALCAWSGREVSKALLFDAVQASERVFHGNPSGLDASVALYGGAIVFSKRDGARPITAPAIPLLIVHSGEHGETRREVARVARMIDARPEEARARLGRIAALVEGGIAALGEGDLETLGGLMNQNHDHLSWFGVSTPSLDHIVDTARRAGAWGAKMTGSGGGGVAIVLAPEKRRRIATTLKTAGYSVMLP